jgi:hypothetical protein
MKGALAVLILAVALPLHAQDSKPKLIAELLDLLDAGNFAEVLLTPPSDADEKTQAVMNGLRFSLGRAEVLELYAPLFDEEFTVEELQSLVEFYRSAAGRKSARFLVTLGTAEYVRWILLSSDRAEALADEYDRRRSDPALMTMSDLRTVAQATEAYATDTDEYPRVTGMEELRQLLEPTYVKTMPSADAWGTTFFYISDGQHYRFISAGADRRFEWDAQRLETEAPRRETDDPARDLIFQNGDFIQLPRQPEAPRQEP